MKNNEKGYKVIGQNQRELNFYEILQLFGDGSFNDRDSYHCSILVPLDKIHEFETIIRNHGYTPIQMSSPYVDD